VISRRDTGIPSDGSLLIQHTLAFGILCGTVLYCRELEVQNKKGTLYNSNNEENKSKSKN
jgi:hypothetical protein